MATVTNTSAESFPPLTGAWNGVPSWGTLLYGNIVVAIRPMTFEDQNGQAITVAPDATKTVRLPAGEIDLTFPPGLAGEVTAAYMKAVVDEMYASSRTYTLKIHSAQPNLQGVGSEISGGGYDNISITAWTTAL